MSDLTSTLSRLRGSFVAIVTPMKNGAVDEDALKRLIDWHIENGTNGLVPVGTTGESATLSHEEHHRVVSLTVEHVAGRIAVIAGAGSNSTTEGIGFVQHAAGVGADAALVVTPYYNKPNQRMLIEHYRTLHDCADIPIMIYNIPGRSVIDMTDATMAELAKLPRIIGNKCATGDLARCGQERLDCGKDFVLLSGEDATAVGYNAMGGVGCISVSANVAPAACSAMQAACLAGDYKTALDWQDKLYPLHRAMFMESSPAPAKYALSLLGLCENEMRAPIYPVMPETEAAIRAAMDGLGLLES